MKIPFQKAILPALVSSTLMLSACGGGSSSSTDSTNSLTSGIITGFGSIYVNGIKFETDSASFDIDDDGTASQDDLRVGMHVKINGEINTDGMTGTAYHVFYENELEGPVSHVDASDPSNILITILGIQVQVTPDTSFDHDDNNLSMDSIVVGDLLEVSGYTSASGIVATHIELQNESFTPDVTEVEIKGEIESGSLGSNSFSINGLTIQFDSSTELEDIPANALTEGLYVEVKGTLNAMGDILTATKIEAEDDAFGDDVDDVELEGLISEYNSTSQTFIVQNQLVDASQSPILFPSNLVLANDLKVEVEGELVNGVLYADEIQLKGRKIKIHAPISRITLNPDVTTEATISFSLFGGTDNLTVRVNHQTEMEDDVGLDDNFTVSDLMVGYYVELEAFDDGTSVINAVELDRKEADDVQLEGPVTAFDATLNTVTMFGQSFDLSTASYENDMDHDISAEAFFGQLAIGSFIELTDVDADGSGPNLPDGIIDKAELEEEDDD